MKTALTLVAHRGWSSKFPENTLLSFSKAIDAGANCVEFDVQLSADETPMVIHDAALKRTTGLKGCVMETSANKLAAASPHFPSRFGDKFKGVGIPTLKEVVELLNKHPGATAFVEAKRQSVEKFGAPLTAEKIMEQLSTAKFNWALISFNREVLEFARKHFDAPIGFIIRKYDPLNKLSIEEINPEFAFVDFKNIPPTAEALWEGGWIWAVYGIESAEHAEIMAQKGASMVECDDIGALIDHHIFSRNNCDGARKR